jgi:hypothetical protein
MTEGPDEAVKDVRALPVLKLLAREHHPRPEEFLGGDVQDQDDRDQRLT